MTATHYHPGLNWLVCYESGVWYCKAPYDNDWVPVSIDALNCTTFLLGLKLITEQEYEQLS